MTIQAWTKNATDTLSNSSIETPLLDAQLLCCHVLNKSKAWFHAHSDFDLSDKQLNELVALLSRRCNHEPMAYILGRIEFFKRDFVITKDVLVPRPESETMIELVLAHGHWDDPKIVDIGAGSGALGVTLALETSSRQAVSFIDIDKGALDIAKQNTEAYGLEGQFFEQNLLHEQRDAKYDIVLANLPYVPDGYPINEAAEHEPPIALYGGDDGLDLYRQMFQQLGHMTHRVKLVATESLPTQHETLETIANQYGFKKTAERDLIMLFE